MGGVVVMAKQPPPPGEVHPAYANNAGIQEWVERTGPLAERHRVQVPISRPVNLRSIEDDVSALLTSDGHTLTIGTAWGLAPYVGDPFVYEWRVGTDELGRSVASQPRRQMLPEPCPVVIAKLTTAPALRCDSCGQTPPHPAGAVHLRPPRHLPRPDPVRPPYVVRPRIPGRAVRVPRVHRPTSGDRSDAPTAER